VDREGEEGLVRTNILTGAHLVDREGEEGAIGPGQRELVPWGDPIQKTSL